jgi:hypothetical protein
VTGLQPTRGERGPYKKRPFTTGIYARLGRLPKLTNAACKGRADAFDRGPHDDYTEAARLCRTCAAFAECRTWAETTKEPLTGYIAGRTYVLDVDGQKKQR